MAERGGGRLVFLLKTVTNRNISARHKHILNPDPFTSSLYRMRLTPNMSQVAILHPTYPSFSAYVLNEPCSLGVPGLFSP